MPILVKCGCGKSLKAPDKAAGKAVRCPECGEAVKVAVHKAEPAAENVDEFDDLEFEPQRSRAPRAPARLPGAVRKSASTKTKSKPASQPAEAGIPKWVWGVLAVIGFGVGGLGGYLVMQAILGAAANSKVVAKAEPLTFSTHECKDGNFRFDYPNGWEVASGGGTGGVPPWGTFKKGDVEVDIRADSKGAPIADMASINPGEELPPEETPVAKVHQIQYEIKYKHVFDDLEEQPGRLYKVPFGEGWLAEFTASEGAFGGKIHGYRLTLLGGVHQFNVICKCKEQNWETKKPLFERAMQSISR